MASSNPYRRADRFSQKARQQGFPARSVFKLEEIDRRCRILAPGQHVLDLGAAPGSWTIFASQRVGSKGRVLAIDLKALDGTFAPNVTTLQGDALSLENSALETFAPYQVVLSDMAPSTMGLPEADHARSAELFLRALDVARQLGAPGSSFVGKLFMGAEFEAVRAELRKSYAEVRVIRPESTRRCSVELFLIGMKSRPQP